MRIGKIRNKVKDSRSSQRTLRLSQNDAVAHLTGGFLFMNISMAFSSSGSTMISLSHSASPGSAAPSDGHSSSESASWEVGPKLQDRDGSLEGHTEMFLGVNLSVKLQSQGKFLHYNNDSVLWENLWVIL